MVNAYNLDDFVGHYISDQKFKIKDKVLKVTPKDVGYNLGLSFNGAHICLQREDEIKYETCFWNNFLNDNQVSRWVASFL